MVGFLAAGLVVATLSMRTMISLRIVGLASNVAFVTYGALFGSIPTVILHAILFPLNIYRLHEMLKLVKQVEEATKGDMSLGWLKPFMSERAIAVGETLFRKGERANHLYFLVSGQLHLQEINLDLAPGAVVGELGMLAPERTRTRDSGSARKMAWCWRFPTRRSSSSTTRTRNSDSISCACRRRGCSTTSSGWKARCASATRKC